MGAISIMKIVFLAHNIYGVGGTVRTVVNLANELSKSYSVEIVSVFRRVDNSSFQISPRVKLTALVDTRLGSVDRNNSLADMPSQAISSHEELYSQYNMLTDERLISYLSRLKADVVIASRPGLAILMAKYCHSGIFKIAQEHTSASMLEPSLINELREQYTKIQKVVTVTNFERELFSKLYAEVDVDVVSIPNSFTESNLISSDRSSNLIIAAGRITKAKRFELLIHAFAEIKDQFPDWKLRIYGDGPERANLKVLAQKLGVSNHVQMMGSHGSMDEEWRKASIMVSTSDAESFGMTIIEAMNAGLPVLSTDCPVGPREIIDDGVDGILTPVGCLKELVLNLRKLIEDQPLRERIGIEAFKKSQRYTSANIASEYRHIFEMAGLNNSARKQKSDHKMFIPAAIKLTATSLSGTEFNLDVDVINARFMSSIEIVFHSKTKKAESFSVKLPKTRVSEKISTFSTIVDSSNFETDAIWDTNIRLSGFKISNPHASIDTRCLVSDTYVELSHGFSHIIPFASSVGELRVRSWRRKKHAELKSIHQINSEAVIIIAPPTDTSRLKDAVLARRGVTKSRIGIPIQFLSDGNIQLLIDFERLAEEAIEIHEDWDLFLREEGRRVRVGKIIDDVHSKKHIYSFPAWNHIESSADDRIEERVTVRPYLSIRNDLSFSVRARKL